MLKILRHFTVKRCRLLLALLGVTVMQASLIQSIIAQQGGGDFAWNGNG